MQLTEKILDEEKKKSVIRDGQLRSLDPETTDLAYFDDGNDFPSMSFAEETALSLS